VKIDHAIWGNTDRRDVFLRFEVITLNERGDRMASVVKTFLAKHPAMKVLVYTNHAKDAKGRLNSRCLKVLEEMTEDANVDIVNPNAIYVLQGQETDMMKVRIMSGVNSSNKLTKVKIHVRLVLEPGRSSSPWKPYKRKRLEEWRRVEKSSELDGTDGTTSTSFSLEHPRS
jgi:hypothetical protein